MCLSRLVARAGVDAKEVRAFTQTDLDADVLADARERKSDGGAPRQFEFDSLDIIEIAPWIVLQAAQDKARAIIEEARVKVEELRQEALRRGTEEGREEAKQAVMPALAAFSEAEKSLLSLEERLIGRYAPELVVLALEIAEKIIGKAVAADGKIIASVLERTKREIRDAKQIRIWLHPEDWQTLSALRPDLVKTGDEGGRTVEILPLDEIGRGGCRLETESGFVDATLPSQIEEIRRQLLDEDSSNSGKIAAGLTAQT